MVLVNVGKEKLRKEKRIDIEKFLEEEELKKLVENGESLQKKAFLGCLYESGARPEEFLTLSSKDIIIDQKERYLSSEEKQVKEELG